MPVYRSSKIGGSLNAINRALTANRAQFGPGVLTSRTTGGVIRKPTWKASTKSIRMFPFRVYLSPFAEANAWRTFLVRAGRVGSVDVAGTDLVSYPDSSELATDGTNEIEVPASESAYPIYIRQTASTIEVKHGLTDWSMYPAPHTTEGTVCIPIAEINTQTLTDDGGLSKIRQLLRCDIPDVIQACVSDGGTDRVANVLCWGGIFDFV